MREQVQVMGSKQAALQAHNSTLAGEVERWKALWRQSASANQDLNQRLAARAIDQQVGQPHPDVLSSAKGALGVCCPPITSCGCQPGLYWGLCTAFVVLCACLRSSHVRASTSGVTGRLAGVLCSSPRLVHAQAGTALLMCW